MSSVEITVEGYTGSQPCYGMGENLVAGSKVRWVNCPNPATKIIRASAGLSEIKSRLTFHACEDHVAEMRLKAAEGILP